MGKCDNIVLLRMNLTNLISECGNAKGIDLIVENNDIVIENINVNFVNAKGMGMLERLRYCKSVGIHLQNKNKNINMERLVFDRLECPMNEPTGVCIDDDNSLKTINLS